MPLRRELFVAVCAAAALLACLAVPSSSASPGRRPAQAALVARPGSSWQRTLPPELLRGGVLRLEVARDGAPAPAEPLSIERLDATEEVIERELAPVRPDTGSGCYTLQALDWSRRDRLGGRVRVDGPADDGFIGGGIDGRAYEVRPLPSARSPVRVTFDWSVRQETPPRTRVLDLRDIDSIRLAARGDLTAARLDLVDAHGSRAQVAPAVTAGGPDGWRSLLVPLAGASGIDRRAMARLEIELPAGSPPLQLDRLRLCPAGATAESDADADVPSAALGRAGSGAARDGEPDPRAATASGPRASVRALWVWNTRTLLAERAARTALTGLLVEGGFNRVYLQLPGAFAHGGAGADLTAALAALTAALKRAGAEVWALDGAPEMARAAEHASVLARIAAIAAFNGVTPAASHFAGVQLDVEPYLLPEFAGDEQERVVAEYLLLLAAVRARCQAAGLPFEAAVPFFFDGIGVTRRSGQELVYRPLVEEVLDRVDGIAVMDYRTTADGDNGTLALAEQELLYASAVGKRVVLALETTELSDALHLHFRGPGARLPLAPVRRPDASAHTAPRSRPAPAPPSTDRLPARADDGWVLAATTADGLRLWWLQEPAREALVAFARDADIEEASARAWPVSHTVRVAASRMTFAPLDAATLERVLRETAARAALYPAFAGMAVHHFESLQRLRNRTGAPR